MDNFEERLFGAREEEQRRIGADLHDGLGQYLTGIACLAAALRDELRADRAGEAAQADELARLASDAIDLTRGYARCLFPLRLEQGGLCAALEDLVEQVRRVHGVECSFQNGGPPLALGSEAALQLYRIAQEAINNAVRHGAANRIAVKLKTRNRPSRLVIEDNGRGFSPAARRSKGMGLQLMERRAARIGASVRIAPRPKGGTRVECMLKSR